MQNLLNRALTLWTDYRFIMAVSILIIWGAMVWIMLRLIFNAFHKLAQKTRSNLDDLILKEAFLPLLLAMFISAFPPIAHFSGLSKGTTAMINRVYEISVVLLALLFIARLLFIIIQKMGTKNEALRPFIPTFTRIINVIFFGIGALMVLDALGISITPMLATLGIGGLAVGLALQDTLANFFSGIYILFSQPVRVGDYVRLENGDNGYVRNIGWRETRIQTLPGNIIVVPNSKLSQMVVTNYYLPDKQMACLVQVGVSYDSDLAKVERVTNEVSQKVLKEVAGGAKEFTPFIRYHTFADFSINFTVILRVNEFVDKYLLTHEFIKALHKRYREEGIEIPFPIRTVHMKKD